MTTAAFGTFAIMRLRILADAHLLQLALDGRIAFVLLVLFLHLLEGHFLPFVPLPVLEEVIGGGDDSQHRNHRAHDF